MARNLDFFKKDEPQYLVVNVIEESKILFAFPRVMGLFLRSEAPGLVFSVTYPWGSFAPSAFSAYGGAKSRKGRRPPTSHFRKPPRPSYF